MRRIFIGDIHVGENNTVRGNNGNNGQSGGDVDIESTGGDVTNDGTIRGGDGGTGSRPRDGGSVTAGPCRCPYVTAGLLLLLNTSNIQRSPHQRWKLVHHLGHHGLHPAFHCIA